MPGGRRAGAPVAAASLPPGSPHSYPGLGHSPAPSRPMTRPLKPAGPIRGGPQDQRYSWQFGTAVVCNGRGPGHARCTSLPAGERIEAQRGPGGHVAPKTSCRSVRCSGQAVRREPALHRMQESGQAQHSRYTMSQGWRRGVSIVPTSLPRASWYVMVPCRADMAPVSALPRLHTRDTWPQGSNLPKTALFWANV